MYRRTARSMSGDHLSMRIRQSTTRLTTARRTRPPRSHSESESQWALRGEVAGDGAAVGVVAMSISTSTIISTAITTSAAAAIAETSVAATASIHSAEIAGTSAAAIAGTSAAAIGSIPSVAVGINGNTIHPIAAVRRTRIGIPQTGSVAIHGETLSPIGSEVRVARSAGRAAISAAPHVQVAWETVPASEVDPV